MFYKTIVCLCLSALCLVATGRRLNVATSTPDDILSGLIKEIKDENAHNVVKSAYDFREYRHVTLESGLPVLLVSDPTSTLASAAVDVGAGSWDDPEEAQGLFHFLEHMLFLGSAKYPDQTIDDFITPNGGSTNAYTDAEHTNYYFSVHAAQFPRALDMFAQFFIGPLLTQSASGREMNAVNAEHLKNLQSDDWRTYGLESSLALKSNPAHKFGTGSLETFGAVSADHLHELLVGAWNRFYTADNIHVAIVGPDSLDELEKLAKTSFNGIRPGDGTPKHGDAPNTDVFPQSILGAHEVQMQGVLDESILSITWIIPPHQKQYRSKSVDFLTNLIGNEGTGSPAFELKMSKGWIYSLDVYQGRISRLYEDVTIDISLTPDGVANIDEVRAAIFGYIELIAAKGVEEWRYNELGLLWAMDFHVKSKEAAEDYASSLASSMRSFPPREVLTGDWILANYDQADIEHVLSLLTPQRALTLLKTKGPDSAYSKTELHYGIRYSIAPLSLPSSSDNHKEWMSLLGPNQYIPKSLELVGLARCALAPSLRPNGPSESECASSRHISNGQNLPAPTIVRTIDTQGEPLSRVWFAPDAEFGRPRVNLRCRLWSRLVHSSPRASLLTSLALFLTDRSLTDVLWSASNAGMGYSSASTADSIDYTFSGYSDSFDEFVGKVMEAHNVDKGFKPTQAEFEQAMANIAQDLANNQFQPLYQHGMGLLASLRNKNQFHISQLAAELVAISLADVIEWQRSLFNDAALECLFHGNVDADRAKHVTDTFIAARPFQTKSKFFQGGAAHDAAIQIFNFEGQHVVMHLSAQNPGETNSLGYKEFQLDMGGTAGVPHLYCQLLEALSASPVYAMLRTQEQLGYIVWAFSREALGVQAFGILVQSGVYDSAHLMERIDASVTMLSDLVNKLSEEDFKSAVKSLLSEKETPFDGFDDVTGFFWSEIIQQQYMWDRREVLASLLRGDGSDAGKVSLDGFQNFANRILRVDKTPANDGGIFTVAIDPQPPVSVEPTLILSVGEKARAHQKSKAHHGHGVHVKATALAAKEKLAPFDEFATVTISDPAGAASQVYNTVVSNFVALTADLEPFRIETNSI